LGEGESVGVCLVGFEHKRPDAGDCEEATLIDTRIKSNDLSGRIKKRCIIVHLPRGGLSLADTGNGQPEMLFLEKRQKSAG